MVKGKSLSPCPGRPGQGEKWIYSRFLNEDRGDTNECTNKENNVPGAGAMHDPVGGVGGGVGGEAAGADCAIGFKTGINCGLANTWMEKFFEFYSQGRTIDESAQQATSNSRINIEDMRIVS